MADLIVDVDIVIVKPSFKGLTGTWSKYGGKRISIAYNQHGIATADQTWTCQSCGHAEPVEISPRLYQYPVGEVIRICYLCERDNCSRLRDRMK